MLKDKNSQIEDIIRKIMSNESEGIFHSFNKEELIQYAKENNIDIDIILKAMENYEKNSNNDEVNMDDDLKEIIINSYKDLKKDIRVTKSAYADVKKELSSTKWALGLLITVFGIITPLLFNMHSESINAKFESINTNINAKFELIEQRLDSQKELNQLQIERDVSKEFLNHKK